MTRKQRHSRP